MLLIATCSVYAWILTYENLPTMLADNFFNLIQSKWAFLLILNVFLLIVGMFVDMTPALIMLVPMLIPLALKFDINLVHLGLIMVINLSFGLTTPPVGTALFVALKVGESRWRRSSRRCCRCSPACAWCCCSSPTCRRSTCGCRAASGSSNSQIWRLRGRHHTSTTPSVEAARPISAIGRRCSSISAQAISADAPGTMKKPEAAFAAP